MSSTTQQLESCWDLALQDTMFDVQAAIAATEPQPAAEQRNSAAAQPALSLHWMVRMPDGKAS